jgi:hypothetical protein
MYVKIYNAEIDDLKMLAYGKACMWEGGGMHVATHACGCACVWVHMYVKMRLVIKCTKIRLQ